MLTYRTGAAGAPAAAKAMAEYLAKESHIAGLSDKLAAYYGHGLMSDEGITTAGLPVAGMDASIANLLGIDPHRPLSTMEVAHLLTGLTTQGDVIPGKKQQTEKQIRIAYLDFTLSAPKSFSIAATLAPTESERAMLDKCHTDAVDKTLAIIADTVGSVSKGDTRKNFVRDKGHVAIIKFEHNTARPTEMIAGEENGVPTTTPKELGVGDMHRHSHCIMPAICITDEGRVGSIHQDAIKQRIHEWGAIYQAILATNLRRIGVEVELDNRPGLQFNDRMARLLAVPHRMVELFSKRTANGREAAREFAAKRGIDYDSLSPSGKIELLANSVSALKKSKGEDAQADIAAWRAEAEAAGYNHRSVLRPGEEREPREDRVQAGYDVSLPLLETQWTKNAVIKGAIARTAAAKALIATGTIDPVRDLNAITAAYRTEGVRQDGVMTRIHWAFDPAEHYARMTTQLSVDQEHEAIRILKTASKDKSTVLSSGAVQRAVDKVSAEGFDFTTEHGLKQREVIARLAASGRASIAIGVAGSGKTTIIRPLVEAWNGDGRNIYGVTLGWRQTAGLRDAGIGKKRLMPVKDTLLQAGIEEQKTFALTPFLMRLETGNLKLDRNSVVVIDEIALIGTSQMLRLARLQAAQGFQLVGIGDDKQGQSLDAGATVDLCRRAFGADNVPELLSTVRQLKERDRETSLMFRDGNAKEALTRKDEDGQIHIVAGGYEDAVRATVDLWFERRNANADRDGYTLGISVPTNADGLAIGEEIRKRRIAAGEVGETICRIEATDQTGAQFKLDLSVGDRVRLFDRVFGKDANNHYGFVGNNGSIVEVAGVDEHRLMVRSASGKIVAVEWEDLRNGGDRIRLTRGDAVTIDARQSETLTEHITAMPTGSAAVNGFKAYVAESRQREASWIVTSQGAEQMEVAQRRALGDPRNDDANTDNIKAAILQNMARNLSRQPTKTLATEFLERAVNLRSGAISSMQAAWFRQEMREAEDKPPLATEERKIAQFEESEIIVALPPTAEETAIARRAALVADGRWLYSEALDDLLHRYIKNGGDIDNIEQVEDRYGIMLSDAAEAAAVRLDARELAWEQAESDLANVPHEQRQDNAPTEGMQQ